MAELLRVPEVAAGATEAILVEWLVGEGTAFKTGEPIALIETDKANVEVEAETDGVLLRALANANTKIIVGSPMAVVGAEDERGVDVDALLAQLGVDNAPGQPAPPRREIPDAEVESSTPERGQRPEDVTAAAGRVQDQPQPGKLPPGRLFTSPIARKMLKDAGIAPDQVVGSGPDGRIVRRDVERAIAARADRGSAVAGGTPPTTAARPVQPGHGYREVPHSRLRRAVASRLTASKQVVPHFYVQRTVRVDRLLELREQVNAHLEQRVSVNDFVLKAVAVAHARVPEANVTWTDEAMRQYDSVDVAVAIASDRGLVTPVLRAVENMSLRGISTAVRSLAAAANTGKLQQRDLEGGSISVTNLGMYDVQEFSAIINPPHSSILAVGAAHAVPVVEDGQVIPARCMSLVLSVDHRAIDGALAAQWMQALVAGLENPLTLLVC
ncbi:dihydrolipoamide acetyltransferase family protein [Micromonospora fulviviridis]|uniref:Dihydrolipoamide acetyltransferase component of pyruvate dehydrogenase complex n=1 Tax=Micromonospora fulviviridis TaxID=47860 RepID=A0ABV2VTV7_9ACTN